MQRGLALFLSLCLLGQARAAGADMVMRLASLEWQPYVSSRMAHDGWSSYVVDTAARRFGYRAKIDYFPWTRAMQLGMKDAQYAGYFPAYYTQERAQQCYFSSSIGSSTIGFAYLKSAPLQWQSLQDLETRSIAVVAGFSNGPTFDEWVRQHKLTVDASPSDTLNLRKLLAHRVDTVVIDKLVLRYLLATEPTLAKERDRIVFHERPLAELSLHVCFRKTPDGHAMQQAFDTALHSLPLHKMEDDYFQRIETSVVP
ncbi:MAG: substrate-binding periplasmic protein [Bacillota bacterium]